MAAFIAAIGADSVSAAQPKINVETGIRPKPWYAPRMRTAAYWFTSSTSFANPAVTIARSFTDTFSGIRPVDAPVFIVCQTVGALLATWIFAWLLSPARSAVPAAASSAAE